MGLPMFREPDEVVADQPAAKLERASASRRSAIRREPSVRPGRITSSRPLIDRIRETRQEPSNEPENSTTQPRQVREDERDISQLDAELSRFRSVRRQRARATQLERELSRRSGRDRPGPSRGNETGAELLTSLRSSTAAGSSSGDAILDSRPDIFSSEVRDAIARYLPRPSRESGLRFEVAAATQSETQPQPLTDTHLRNAALLRNASASRRSGPTDDDTDIDETQTANLTPGFAPARGLFDGTVELMEERRARRSEHDTLDGFIDDTPPESFGVSYPTLPPLRRVNHASPRLAPGSSSRIDGLGDRLRSPSPGSEGAEEENWATLLTTMDPSRSSATTSFMSSRPDSGSDSNRSSQATTVGTSFGEIGADDSCDLDLPSGITEADVQEIRARHGRLPSGATLARRENLSPDAVQRDIDRARGNNRILELEVFSVILDRMQRREEIPEEWWAAVGLSPDVVRGSA